MDLSLISQWSDLNEEIWSSSKPILLANKFWTASQLSDAKEMASSQKVNSDFVWIASSGSSQSPNQSFKLFGLTRTALIASAKSVNAHLMAIPEDSWLSPLPVFHVGGLSTFVRANLLGSKFFSMDNWDPKLFYENLSLHEIAFTSLVPTQLFDLVRAELKGPSALKAVLVGGAKLDESLYLKARELSWPILPSFGMTEVGSQVATAELLSLNSSSFPRLKVLSHVTASVDSDCRLSISASSLFSICLQKIDGVIKELKPTQIFLTSDRAQLSDGFLTPLGRSQRFVKVLGEGVQLDEVQERMNQKFKVEGLLVSIPEERRGAQLVWVTGPHQISDEQLKQLVQKWNSENPGHHRLGAWIELEKIPLSHLGKPLYGEIEKSVAERLRQNV